MTHHPMSARLALISEHRCGNCRFHTYPDCRRHAPIGAGETKHSGGDATWPHTSPFDWCGDFELSERAKQEADEIKQQIAPTVHMPREDA